MLKELPNTQKKKEKKRKKTFIHKLWIFLLTCLHFNTDDVKQLAVDICECLRKTLGTTFEQVYGEIRKYLKVKRDKRKQEIKLMAVVNPMRNATRKLRIAAKHRANKRKKNAGTHGAYKRRKLLA